VHWSLRFAQNESCTTYSTRVLYSNCFRLLHSKVLPVLKSCEENEDHIHRLCSAISVDVRNIALLEEKICGRPCYFFRLSTDKQEKDKIVERRNILYSSSTVQILHTDDTEQHYCVLDDRSGDRRTRQQP